MLSSIGQNNNVQRFSAVNALKSSSNSIKTNQNENNLLMQDSTSATKAAPKGLLDRVDLGDIRKCAQYVGEYNISDEDIKYGLMYGRSVIAEYLC